jgi:putative oxidoreductase
VGVIFLVHGIQKLGMWKMQPSAQMPAGMLSMVKFLSIVEPLGGLAVLVGFLTQFAAVALGIIMIGAIQFKMGQMHKKFSVEGGWEFDLILLAAAIALLFSGADSLGMDRVLFGI